MRYYVTIGERTFEYDAFGRMIRVSDGGRALAEYSYNAFGERIRKVVYSGSGRSVAYFFYDGAMSVLQPLIDSGKVKGTENTYTVHHYAGTWLDPKEIRRIRRGRMLCSVFGERAGWRIHRRIASFGRLYGNLRRNIRKDGLFGGLAKTRRGRRAWRREHPRRR